MITLTGTLTCPTADDLKIVETYLPDHIRLSRAEPGCIRFNAAQTSNPMVWQVDECFADKDALAAHQTRNSASVWWQKSQSIVRDFQFSET